MYYAHESVIKHWNRDLLFNDINKPIGVADYQLIGSKENLQRLLCEEIEAYEMNSDVDESAGDCTKEIEHCIKDSKKQKALMQISRKIYHCIENDSRICVSTMAKQLDLSVRQLQYHLKTLQTLKKIARVGGRKLGEWKIIDKNYPAGFGE